MKGQLQARFEGQRVGHIEDLMVCSMLDPRFKNFDFKRATSENRKLAVHYTCLNFLENFAPPLPEKEASPTTSGQGASAPTQRPKKKQKVNKGFLESDSDESEEESEADDVEDEAPEPEDGYRSTSDAKKDPRLEEVEKYMALPQVKGDMDFDVLLWWKLHGSMFPNLARMARQFLASPASSAGVERLFSEATDMHGDKRKSLKEETFMQMLFISKNIDDI